MARRGREKTRCFRYCRREHLAAALAEGWTHVADFDDVHHGAYCAGLVEWAHDGEAPAWPPRLPAANVSA